MPRSARTRPTRPSLAGYAHPCLSPSSRFHRKPNPICQKTPAARRLRTYPRDSLARSLACLPIHARLVANIILLADADPGCPGCISPPPTSGAFSSAPSTARCVHTDSQNTSINASIPTADSPAKARSRTTAPSAGSSHTTGGSQCNITRP